ncbi:MAG: histidine phosphatase family protein [Sulfitobacter sp.]
MISVPPLYILRHGETEWNAKGLLQGKFDSALTPKGRAQALHQQALLKTCDLTGFAAITSPQARAEQTAQIALAGVISPITRDDRLREIGLGAWAGEHRARLLRAHAIPNGFALYERAPGGEGFAALRARCDAFLSGLTSPAVLVTHGMTSRMLRLILLGLPTTRIGDLPGGQGIVFKLVDGKQELLAKTS